MGVLKKGGSASLGIMASSFPSAIIEVASWRLSSSSLLTINWLKASLSDTGPWRTKPFVAAATVTPPLYVDVDATVKGRP